MQSLLYKLIAAVLVVVSLILFVIYMKSVSRDIRSKTIDDLRDSTSKEGMRELPDIAQLREAAQKNPNSAEAQAALGHALFRRGEYTEALAVLDAAIRLNPADASLFFARAKIQENTSRRDDSIKDYEQGLLLDPKNVPAMMRVAELLRFRRDSDRAIHWYRRALEVEPGNAEAHHRWGQALAQKGELWSAINEFEAAMRADPKNDAVLYKLGMAYRRNADPRNARDAFDRACQVNPRNFRACSEARRLRARE
ncbi:MAG: tetratricopeptide repeat protein [Acidobacteria bacterium]|nr:tetratricopeptide repeat protein [Acidobacteriota bacterium]